MMQFQFPAVNEERRSTEGGAKVGVTGRLEMEDGAGRMKTLEDTVKRVDGEVAVCVRRSSRAFSRVCRPSSFRELDELRHRGFGCGAMRRA